MYTYHWYVRLQAWQAPSAIAQTEREWSPYSKYTPRLTLLRNGSDGDASSNSQLTHCLRICAYILRRALPSVSGGTKGMFLTFGGRSSSCISSG